MNLSQFLSVIKNSKKAPSSSSLSAFAATEVLGLTSSTNEVAVGWVFIAVRGSKLDGHDFISDALSKGACALIVENADKIPASIAVPVVVVENSREALDLLAAEFYENPSRELFVFGVTGTNGKTSITYLIEWIMNSVGVSTGVLGTINHHLHSQVWPTSMTTPGPVALQSRLKEMQRQGARAVAIEVSSHALDQFRADGVEFNTAIFTNLTRDHLDYHQNMESYFQSKQRLFTDLLRVTSKFPSTAVINIDDAWGAKMRVASDSVILTYGKSKSDFQYNILQQDYSSTHFQLVVEGQTFVCRLPMCGLHNVANAVAVIAAALTAGVPIQKSIEFLEAFSGVPGRMQSVKNSRSLHVFVDYAHSPDALENVLASLSQIREHSKELSEGKIWVIFGCGGDRDVGKRPLMAKIACQWADRVMITSDNPRSEDPAKIIQDIQAGVSERSRGKVLSQVDRALSFQQVFSQAQAQDVILIAGKGHEDYQIIGDQKIHFSDLEKAEELLR